MTCRVIAVGHDGSTYQARALLDSASSASFVSGVAIDHKEEVYLYTDVVLGHQYTLVRSLEERNEETDRLIKKLKVLLQPRAVHES